MKELLVMVDLLLLVLMAGACGWLIRAIQEDGRR